MANEFSGKTALVTGASRGIGAATAVALARAGVSRVLLHYNSFREGAEQAAADVRAAGAKCDLLHGELKTEEGIEAFIAALRTTAPAVDILINNAGHLVGRAKLLEMDMKLFNEVMDLNVKSAWFVTQAVAAGMVERKQGVVIFLSSIAARNGGGPGATIYAAAKAAVAAVTKGLARELAPHGIRVNGVSPGTVDNNFHATYSTRQMLDNVVAQTPAGRLGTNDEVADLILFLCSDASRYVHGQTIEINGGMYMV